jgi:hypothetical protein
MRYRGWRYYNWDKKPSKYSQLKFMFGEVVSNIREEFYNLPNEALNELFLDYGSAYGENAASYARNTFSNWKSGKTKLSGQTMERLVELVPPYLSANQRLSLLESLIEKYKPQRPSYNIRINIETPNVGLEKLDEKFKALEVTDELANMPKNVMDAANWLYGDDITLARKIIIQIAGLENKQMKANAVKEIELIRTMIRKQQIKKAYYSVEFPSGSLSIEVYKPSFISKLFGIN